MTTDVSGGEITSQFANDQGVGQCSYPTQVCAITHLQTCGGKLASPSESYHSCTSEFLQGHNNS